MRGRPARSGSRRSTSAMSPCAARRISFRFRGKHNVMVHSAIVDSELAAAIQELIAFPGSRLFKFELDGGRCNLDNRRLNAYIRAQLGAEFTAKDFRTWGGTLVAAVALAEGGPAGSETEAKRRIAAVMRHRRGEARQHARRRACLLRQPGGGRAVSRRAERSSSAAAFASRGRSRIGARSGGAGDAEPAPLVANSRLARRCVVFRGRKAVEEGNRGTENSAGLRQRREGGR